MVESHPIVEILKNTKRNSWSLVRQAINTKCIKSSETIIYFGRDRIPPRTLNDSLEQYVIVCKGASQDEPISALGKAADRRGNIILATIPGIDLFAKVTFRYSHAEHSNSSGSPRCNGQSKSETMSYTMNYTISADYTGDETQVAIKRLAGLRKGPKASQARASSNLIPSVLGKRQFSSISRDCPLSGERINLKRVFHG